MIFWILVDVVVVMGGWVICDFVVIGVFIDIRMIWQGDLFVVL